MQITIKAHEYLTKTIEGYEGLYEICSNGLVYSVPREYRWCSRGSSLKKGVKMTGGFFLKMRHNKDGYLRVSLHNLLKGRNPKTFNVHRLVAEYFLPKPNGEGFTVNHKNGVKTDNRIENLEWMTIKENIRHAWKTGLAKPITGERNHSSKLSLEQINEIRKLAKKGKSQKEIGIIFGTSQTNVGLIIRNKTWK